MKREWRKMERYETKMRERESEHILQIVERNGKRGRERKS
jgi:hypothetical protein